MKPKEKAEELVERMYACAEINEYTAKRCALVAVDELINAASPVYDSFWPMNTKDYWTQVKEEIEKI